MIAFLACLCDTPIQQLSDHFVKLRPKGYTVELVCDKDTDCNNIFFHEIYADNFQSGTHTPKCLSLWRVCMHWNLNTDKCLFAIDTTWPNSAYLWLRCFSNRNSERFRYSYLVKISTYFYVLSWFLKRCIVWYFCCIFMNLAMLINP